MRAFREPAVLNAWTEVLDALSGDAKMMFMGTTNSIDGSDERMVQFVLSTRAQLWESSKALRAIASQTAEDEAAHCAAKFLLRIRDSF